MTVEELMELLEQFPPEAEVRIAQQPSWPFEYSIHDVAAVPEDDDTKCEDVVVYIVEGQQLGYLPGDITQEIGWAS